MRTPTRTFRPQRVLQEDRTTPTVVTGPLQAPNLPVETINTVEVTAFAEVPAVSTLTANFKNVFGAQTNRVDVKIVAGSGVEFLTSQGNEITQLQDSFVLDEGYNPGNWVAFTVGVAQRNGIL